MENTNNVKAVFCMCNYGGIEILEIENGINDSIVYRYNFGTPENKNHKARIYYTVSGNAYFKTKTGRVYLSECMRV